VASDIAPFVGAWRLVSSEHRQDNGKVTYPLGQSAQGLILYTSEGYMSAALMDPRRPEFRSPELYGGTDQEKIAAMTGYVHYAGRFEVRDQFVIHHVDVSLFPNWIGTAQQRYFRFFDKDKLELRTNPFSADGVRQTAYLVWERASQP
jgi:hypothetical protein